MESVCRMKLRIKHFPSAQGFEPQLWRAWESHLTNTPAVESPPPGKDAVLTAAHIANRPALTLHEFRCEIEVTGERGGTVEVKIPGRGTDTERERDNCKSDVVLSFLALKSPFWNLPAAIWHVRFV